MDGLATGNCSDDGDDDDDTAYAADGNRHSGCDVTVMFHMTMAAVSMSCSGGLSV